MTCPNDVASIGYVNSLENRIKELENKLEKRPTKDYMKSFVGTEVDKKITPISALVELIKVATDAIKRELTKKTEKSELVSFYN
jgi:hypothetical protein